MGFFDTVKSVASQVNENIERQREREKTWQEEHAEEKANLKEAYEELLEEDARVVGFMAKNGSKAEREAAAEVLRERNNNG